MKIFFAILTVISMVWGLFDCSKEQSFNLTHAWAQNTPGAATPGAAYLTIENHGDAANTLVSVASPAGEARLYQFVAKNGVYEADPVDGYVVPPNKDVTLRPQGTYVAFTSLKEPLKEGDTVPLTLVFSKAGTVHVEALVEKPEATSYQGK